MKFYIAIIGFFICVPFFAQENWTLKKDKDEIQIYTKTTDSSKIKAYKAMMTVKSSLDKVKNVIIDGNQLYTWNYKAIDSKLLQKKSENEYLIWMALDLPWPIRNRDVVIYLQIKRITSEILLITVSSAPNAYEELDEYLRITEFEGYWLLEEKGEEVTITHQMHGDPGGNVPSWFVNTTITRAPYYNFLALRERIE
ncbi:START domain-containing protein [Kordia zhangzhouensis]|uniref:START domain-containing protein n=1 Tax=Kordia zhangzhouensis TaxID=1620405 RepID=UPI00069CAD8C|nr:START domain-containing protein [Kordia zhangzhouensis]